MSGGVKGEQIRDDSVTGADVNESTLILPQFYHASGNVGSSGTPTYIATPGRNGWNTSFQVNEHQLIAPHDGTVTKILVRPTTASGDAGSFNIYTNSSSGSAIAAGAHPVISIDLSYGGDAETVEIILPTPAPIAKGDAYCFAIEKPAPGYGITNVVIAVEWDLST